MSLSAETRARIESILSSHEVVLFMKGTPQFPMCGFSGQVVQILGYLGVPYKGVNVLDDQEIRQGIKDYSNWPTIPQLYVKGEFVGGCDIMLSSESSGRVASLTPQAENSSSISDLTLIPDSRFSSYTVHQSGELEQMLEKAGVLAPLPPPEPQSQQS